jgi:hypothetical protein
MILISQVFLHFGARAVIAVGPLVLPLTRRMWALCVQHSPVPHFMPSNLCDLQSYLSTWNLMKPNNMR